MRGGRLATLSAAGGKTIMLRWILWAILLTLAARAGAAPDGVALFRQGRYQQARGALEAALHAGSGDPQARFYLGRTCLKLADLECAADRFREAVRAAPKRAVYHYWLARAYGAEARAANPIRQAWLALRVRRELRRAVALDPDDVDARIALAGYYLEAPGFLGGGLDAARRQARAILERNPRQGSLLMARIHLRDGDADAAEAVYRRLEHEQEASGAIDSPAAADVYGDYGRFLLRQRRYAEAIVRFRRQAALVPNDPQPRIHLGDAYRGVGRYAAAIAEYRTAQRLKPGLADIDERLREARRQARNTASR